MVLGSSLLEPDSELEDFLRAGVPVSPSFGQTAHWEACVGTALTLGDRVLDLYRRRVDLGVAQGETVLNAVQCCQLLLRSCVEAKLLHLLRAYSPSTLGPQPSLVDNRLQDFWEELLGHSLGAPARRQMELSVSRGGLGVGTLALRHASAYLGSWALCLASVLQRLPVGDATLLREGLVRGSGSLRSVEHVAHACHQLQSLGVSDEKLPQWTSLALLPVRQAQKFFARQVLAVKFKQLLASLDVPGRARLLSCGGVGAGAFLLCTPSEVDGTEVLDGAFCHAVRWRLGLPVCLPDCRCCRFYAKTAGRRCGQLLDELGDHLVCCSVGGHKTFLHSRLVSVVRGLLRDSGAWVPDREVMVLPWGQKPGEAARLEIEYVVAGVRRHVDVVVKHPRAKRVVSEAASCAGAAAAEGEADKLRRYPAVPEAGLHEVVPFAVESFGRLGSSALRLVKDACQRVKEADGRFSGWHGVVLCQRWQARLSCALVSGLWDGAAACWGYSGARAGLWDEVADFSRGA